MAVLSNSENLDSVKLEKVIGEYLFTEKTPLRDEIVSLMNVRPSLKQRGQKADSIIRQITEFIDTFISGIAA